MTGALAPLAAVFLAASLLGPGPGAHYAPQAGDSLTFTETISVGGGHGNYTGYSDTDAVNGTLNVTSVDPNGTVHASFDYAQHYWSSTGTNLRWRTTGTFTFSSGSFLYLRGTDNQSGDNGTEVWFYANNSLGDGASLDPLGTPMTVTSTHEAFDLGTAAGSTVWTISTDGSGSYLRNDAYGVFTAHYDWKAYFDPGTGYVVGYVYTESDADGHGDGFEYTDTLRVTHTSYALSAAPSPATYTVTFTQSGLAAVARWTVTFNGLAYPASGGQLQVSGVPNGSYVYVLNSVGYASTPRSGNVSVSGAPVTVSTQWTRLGASSAPPFPWAAVVGLVVLVLIVVLVVLILLRARRRSARLPRHPQGGYPQFTAPPPSDAAPPPLSLTPSAQPSIQQVVVREVVKVKCQYCGSLIDSTAPSCPFCGATRS